LKSFKVSWHCPLEMPDSKRKITGELEHCLSHLSQEKESKNNNNKKKNKTKQKKQPFILFSTLWPVESQASHIISVRPYEINLLSH